jgi:hypothetical protein
MLYWKGKFMSNFSGELKPIEEELSHAYDEG